MTSVPLLAPWRAYVMTGSYGIIFARPARFVPRHFPGTSPREINCGFIRSLSLTEWIEGVWPRGRGTSDQVGSRNAVSEVSSHEGQS